jgi:shikimate 5-dehydrogenase
MNLSNAVNEQTKQKLFVSLASRPGTTGTTFYNKMFDYHDIDAEYVACSCTDLAQDIALARETCAGVSITMPFKLEVNEYIDEWMCEPGPVNTVKIDQGLLLGYNCDQLGLEDSISHLINNKAVIILGDGAMSKNVIDLCKKYNAGFKQVSRKLGNWELRHEPCDVLINCTSLGMSVNECPVESIDFAKAVVDCVIGRTKLLSLAKQSGIPTISGAEIYLSQFKHQFKIYTDIDVDLAEVEKLAKKVFNYV